MEKAEGMPVVQCEGCSATYIPPVYVCRKCQGTKLKESLVNGRGVVYTYTTIRVAPEALRSQVPYTIVIVELAPGLRVTGRLEASGEGAVRIGQQVRFVKVDDAGYWFAPMS